MLIITDFLVGESVGKEIDFCLTLCLLTAKLKQFCLGSFSETIFFYLCLSSLSVT
jgi:hypothetical protein